MVEPRSRSKSIESSSLVSMSAWNRFPFGVADDLRACSFAVVDVLADNAKFVCAVRPFSELRPGGLKLGAI